MKKKTIIPVISAMLLMLSGCGADNDGRESVYTFTDSLDREVAVKSFERTAVLSGSLAEIWQLAGGELYGVTSDAVDRNTLTLSDDVKIYGGVHILSAENIIADGVDFAVLSSTIADQVELADTLEPAGVTTAYFDVEDFEDYLSALKIFTDITRRDDLYEKNGEAVRERCEAVIKRSEGKGEPKIVLLRAYSTGVKARNSDNMTGKMLADLGCVNIADSDSSLLEELSLEAIVRAEPDFVFVTTMGADESAAVASYENILASNKAWEEMDAVKNGNVYFLPKDMFHYKPNERWGEAYEYLEGILYE